MNELQKLKDIGSMKIFQEQDYIFKEGETGEEIYIILSGRVGLYINSADSTQIKVSQLESGDFLGEISLLDDPTRNASAIAERETTVIAVTKDNFQSVICEPSSIVYKIIINLSNQVNHLYKMLRKSSADVELIDNFNNGKTESAPDNFSAESFTNSTDFTTEAKNPNTDIPKIMVGNVTLFPPGHKKYNITAPGGYNDFTVENLVHCPVCGDGFSGKKQLISKLQNVKTDPDFRKHYKDFEPLWYSLWVCPNCLYANFYQEYNAIPVYKKQALLAKTTELKKNYSFEFSFKEPRTIDQVFTAYYLALFSASFYNGNSLKFGKIWLQLSWLYHDIKDEEMFKTAAYAAFDHYYKAVYVSQSDLSVEQLQQCNILLGELYLIKGEPKAAAKHFYSAIKKDVGRDIFNQQAEDRIHDLRLSGL